MKKKEYGLKTTSHEPMAETERRVREALTQEGFGVLTEIDVAQTLKTKLGLDHRPYRILGACNPQLAAEALGNEIDVGLLLPCNVVIYEDGEDTVVSALDPSMMVEMTGNPALESIATEARVRLTRVVNSIADGEE
jgi:uncharacterized protein (DUF302 family)